MATSYVDFQSDTAGTAPDGMTLHHATTHTAMIRDVSGDLVLRMEDDGASGADFCFVTDDAAGTAVTEGEIYAKFTHYEGSAFADLDPYIVIRAATGAANCYGLTHYGSDWAIVYYAAGAASAVVATGFSAVTTTGTKHVVFGVDATTGLYFRIWADGGSDPGAGSNATGTHGSLASGGLGFGSDSYGAQGQIYQYGIGTAGDAAPQSGGGGGAVRSDNLLLLGVS